MKHKTGSNQVSRNILRQQAEKENKKKKWYLPNTSTRKAYKHYPVGYVRECVHKCLYTKCKQNFLQSTQNLQEHVQNYIPRKRKNALFSRNTCAQTHLQMLHSVDAKWMAMMIDGWCCALAILLDD